MSDRTVIGGVTYETVGSSSSNLLLKCNGTARILWGSKLIDLVKNGKILSENPQNLLYIILDESEIKGDGIYIIDTENTQIWICKDNIKYNLTESDLYISTVKKLQLTGELKTLALDNIGILYKTLEDLKNSKILDGIAYVLDTKTLYTIKDGNVEEFSAKFKNITVEQENSEGKIINSSIKIILSILEDTYLILSNNEIVVNQPLIIKETVSISSEGSSLNRGYNLYLKNGMSYLDIDYVNVREDISSFYRGMIVMHSGTVPIPKVWVPCDGAKYLSNNNKLWVFYDEEDLSNNIITTPNLKDKFIEAVNGEGIGLQSESTEELGKRYSILYIMKL